MKKKFGARHQFLSLSFLLVLGGLMIGCAKTAEITLPGFSYLSKKISLDVKEIIIVDQTKTPEEGKSHLIPKSMVPLLQEWAERRFVAAGDQGRAIINFKDATTFEQGLLEPKEVHTLLNSDQPAFFGARVFVTLNVEGTAVYPKGKTDVQLERTVKVSSDVKLGFPPRLWQQFSQTFMNAFDEQMIADLQTYLPHILMQNNG